MSLQITHVAGSNTSRVHGVANLLNASADLIYSSKGLGSYIDVGIDKEESIAGVSIAFYKGDNRKVKFSVASFDSKENKFKLIQNFASSGATAGPENFFFDKPVATKSLRVSFLGSYNKSITFDANALKTAPNNCAGFADGVATDVSPSASQTAPVGGDDGSVNDCFSISRIAFLSEAYVKVINDEKEDEKERRDKEEDEAEKEFGSCCDCDDKEEHEHEHHQHDDFVKSQYGKDFSKPVPPAAAAAVQSKGTEKPYTAPGKETSKNNTAFIVGGNNTKDKKKQ